MKAQLSDPNAGIEAYEIDSLDLANRLNSIAGQVYLATMALAGLADEHGLVRYARPLRELLDDVAETVSTVAADILHRAPALPRGQGGAS